MSFQNNNQETNKEVWEAAGLSELTGYPRKIAEAIVPVINVNPKDLRRCLIVRSATRTTTGSTTLYTVPAGKTFFIVGVMGSYMADVTADNTTINLKATLDGTTSARDLIIFSKLSVTACYDSASISFPNPVKIETGGIVTLGSTFTVGACSMSGTVIGYLADNI